jgi:hypothetical protein
MKVSSNVPFHQILSVSEIICAVHKTNAVSSNETEKRTGDIFHEDKMWTGVLTLPRELLITFVKCSTFITEEETTQSTDCGEIS